MEISIKRISSEKMRNSENRDTAVVFYFLWIFTGRFKLKYLAIDNAR